MRTPVSPISTTEKTGNGNDLRDALGNAALEGIQPRPQIIADLKAVSKGELSPEEYRQRVKARYGVQG